MKATDPVFSVAEVPPTASSPSPLYRKPLPLLTRINYAIRVWAGKVLIATVFCLLRLIRAGKFRAIAPTYTKRYPVRPTLESRVFLPKSYVSGTKLPLYIDIHGGGFTVCDPQTDDEFCHYFSNQFGFCVVSLDYRKAPNYPFPIPVHDCAELARAVLADNDLPIDHERVVLGGFSAGGNLSLAISQFPDLKKKIKAIVPIYPACDFSRKYRADYITTKDGKEDVLKYISELFNWAYVPADVDRTDTLLSTVYATREMLPQKIYFVGAEDDCLCNEAHVLAKKLAVIDGGIEMTSTWNRNGIWWEMVPEQQHGFTHKEARGQEEIDRQRICRELYQRIDSWIKQEVF